MANKHFENILNLCLEKYANQKVGCLGLWPPISVCLNLSCLTSSDPAAYL